MAVYVLSTENRRAVFGKMKTVVSPYVQAYGSFALLSIETSTATYTSISVVLLIPASGGTRTPRHQRSQIFSPSVASTSENFLAQFQGFLPPSVDLLASQGTVLTAWHRHVMPYRG
jgi:hypothetical protein